jgi:hypothetical protein
MQGYVPMLAVPGGRAWHSPVSTFKNIDKWYKHFQDFWQRLFSSLLKTPAGTLNFLGTSLYMYFSLDGYYRVTWLDES